MLEVRGGFEPPRVRVAAACLGRLATGPAFAPRAGIEPATLTLTACRTAVVLPRNSRWGGRSRTSSFTGQSRAFCRLNYTPGVGLLGVEPRWSRRTLDLQTSPDPYRSTDPLVSSPRPGSNRRALVYGTSACPFMLRGRNRGRSPERAWHAAEESNLADRIWSPVPSQTAA